MNKRELIRVLEDSDGGQVRVVFGENVYGLDGVSTSPQTGEALLWARSCEKLGQYTDEELSAHLGLWAPRDPNKLEPCI